MMNLATEIGPTKFDWWPDWKSEAVVIIACGPSAPSVPLDGLKGKVKFVGIKEAFVKFCPWGDAAYGCDAPWWVYKGGLPEFSGLKFCYDSKACDAFPGIKRVFIDDPASDKMLFEEPMKIGAGGNSGFQAVNLVVQFGCRRIGLVGFDMGDKAGRTHWYGRSNWPSANNPDETNFRRWRDALSLASFDLKALDVDVVNLSQASELKCFPKLSVDAMIERWGL